MTTNAINYNLVGVKAHYFNTRLNDSRGNLTTELLRTVADWMDHNEITDSEFSGMVITTETPDDLSCYKTATLYYYERSQVFPVEHAQSRRVGGSPLCSLPIGSRSTRDHNPRFPYL